MEKKIPPGTLIHHDVSCDTNFMLGTVDEIGASIHRAYNFVDKKYPIYLVLDNTGGHGTECAKEEYEKRLRDNYKVCIIWQILNYPNTNKLDLGAWCAVQSDVEYIHQQLVMDSDILAHSVESAFANLSTQKRIFLTGENVF